VPNSVGVGIPQVDKRVKFVALQYGHKKDRKSYDSGARLIDKPIG
jgi:hypothetical protein